MTDDGWEPVNDPAEIRKVLGPKAGGAGALGTQDNIALNKLRDRVGEATGLTRDYRAAMRLLPRIEPSRVPLMNSVLPQEDGGVLNYLSSKLFGGSVAPQERQNYQDFRAIQSGQVLSKQQQQTGPQTESDAARMKLAGIQASNDLQANVPVLMRGTADAILAERKMKFFTNWANKHGLNGTGPGGQTADAAWNKVVKTVYGLEAKQTPRIVDMINRQRGGAAAKSDGWKVEKVSD